MASSYSSGCFFSCCSSASAPNPSSTTRFSLSFSHSILGGYNGISLSRAGSSSRICAKFDNFEGEPAQDSPKAISPSTLPAEPQAIQEEVEEEEADRFGFLPTLYTSLIWVHFLVICVLPFWVSSCSFFFLRAEWLSIVRQYAEGIYQKAILKSWNGREFGDTHWLNHFIVLFRHFKSVYCVNLTMCL